MLGMLWKLRGSLRENLRPTLWCLIFIIAEVVIEVIIPFITADLLNVINNGVTDIVFLKETQEILVSGGDGKIKKISRNILFFFVYYWLVY